MKVLILHSSFSTRGGAEIYVQELQNDLLNQAVDTKVLSGDDLSILPYKRNATSFSRYRYQFLDIFGFRLKRLINEIDAFGPDLIHLNNWARLRSSTIRYLSKKYPTVHTVHDFYMVDPSGMCSNYNSYFLRLAISLRSKLLLFRFKNIVFHFPAERTKDIFQTYSGIIPRNFSVFPLNLNFQKFSYSPPVSLLKLGFIGRLEAHKGIVQFAEEALKFLQDDMSLYIAGEGTQLEQIIQLGSYANIYYIGWLSDEAKAAFFQEIAWLVFTSTWPENFPLVCCEALTFGRPIICPEGCVPPMADQNAVITYGENSLFKSIAEVLVYVSNISDDDYKNLAKHALGSVRFFQDDGSRASLYSQIIAESNNIHG